MALKLLVTISKKIPGAQDYSSTQASVSIEGELTAGQDPVAEASRLQDQAQVAVDQFLGLPSGGARIPAPPPRPATHRPVSSPAGSYGGSQASRPYRQSTRAPAPVTDNQLKLIDRLLPTSGTTLEAVLQHHQSGSLRELTCQQASALIDSLKAGVPA
jgi:hypothetical protein